ncbi:MAG: sugar phosphate isomerase/epimerase [Chloroflexota bacterium]
MRLTVASYSFEVLPLEVTLMIAHTMGFKGVDIAGFHNRGRASYEPSEVAANPQKYADHLNGLLAKYELEAVDFFPQFALDFAERSMNDPDPKVRQQNIDEFRGLVQFCKLTRTPGITVLPGVDHLGIPLEKNLDTAGETFRHLVKIAGDAGVLLHFEAHMGSLTDTPELALALIERAPGTTLTLDYSHFILQYIPIERIHALIPYTGHVHIRPMRPGKLQTRWAKGTVDFVDIAQRLEAVGYKGCLSVEYVCSDWFDSNQVDTLSETIAAKTALESYIPVV